MGTIMLEAIGKIRNELLTNAKKEKAPEYREGYVDGVLDMFNGIAKIGTESPKEPSKA